MKRDVVNHTPIHLNSSLLRRETGKVEVHHTNFSSDLIGEQTGKAGTEMFNEYFRID